MLRAAIFGAMGKKKPQPPPPPPKAQGKDKISAAGKMHGDLQKSMKDSTLQHSLFAAFNTD